MDDPAEVGEMSHTTYHPAPQQEYHDEPSEDEPIVPQHGAQMQVDNFVEQEAEESMDEHAPITVKEEEDGELPDEEGMGDDLAEFIANEEEDEVDEEEERRRRKRKKKRKKKRRREALAEDERRMLAENRGEKYRHKVDIDQDVSSSDDEGGGGRLRKRKRHRTLEEFVESESENEAPPAAGDLQSEPGPGGLRDEAIDEDMDDGGGFVVNDIGEEHPLGGVAHLFGDEIYDIFGGQLPEAEDDVGLEEQKVDAEQRKQRERRAAVRDRRFAPPRERDAPERLWKRYELTTPDQTEHETLDEEANWIRNRAFTTEEKRMMWQPSDITVALGWMKKDFLDVPYIATHKLDNLPDNFKIEDLWLIDKWDERWIAFYTRRATYKTFIMEQIQRNTSGEMVGRMIRSLRDYLVSPAVSDQADLDDIQNVLNCLGMDMSGDDDSPGDQAPHVTVPEATPYEGLTKDDGRERLTEAVDGLKDARENVKTRYDTHTEPTEEGIREIELLKGYYEAFLNAPEGEFDDDEEYAKLPEFTSEEVTIYGGHELDRDALPAHVKDMETKAQELREEVAASKQEMDRELDEMDTLLRFYEKILEGNPKGPRMKKPRKRLASNVLSAIDELSDLLNDIGDVESIAKNLEAVDAGEDPPHHPNATGELNAAIISARGEKFASADKVKEVAKETFARLLGIHPRIRKWVRKQFYEHGKISTEPNVRGQREIDPRTHPLRHVKRLRKKPLKTFIEENSPHWALLRKGEGTLLKSIIVVSNEEHMPMSTADPKAVSFDGDTHKETVEFLKSKMEEAFCTIIKREWDTWRLEILVHALRCHLIPHGVAHIRDRLHKAARETIIEECCTKLRKYAMTGGHDLGLQATNIVACVVGEFTDPTFMVCVNENGDVIDHLALHFMKTHIRINPSVATGAAQRSNMDRKAADTEKFKEWILQMKPGAIVVDASSIKCKHFKIDIEKSLSELKREGVNYIDVVFADPAPSVVYRNTELATQEFQTAAEGYRQAVSLARYVLSPITELTNMWHIDSTTGRNDILALPLSKHMEYFEEPKQQLLDQLRCTLQDCIAKIGVDINSMITRDYLAGPLKFVPGMGEVTAKRLLDKLQRRRYIMSRMELKDGVTVYREEDADGRNPIHLDFLTPNVWKNAASFIRVVMSPEVQRQAGATDDDESPIPLVDDTRCHPEDYEYFHIIVTSATDEEAYTDSILESLRTKQNIHKLEELNFEFFCTSTEQSRGEKISKKMDFIKREVREGFMDPREPFKGLREAELFEVIYGDTVLPGMLTYVQVGTILGHGVRCYMDSGLPAYLGAFDITDELKNKKRELQQQQLSMEQVDQEIKKMLEGMMARGQTLQCRVRSIDVQRFSVRVSCLPEDLEDTRGLRQVPGGPPQEATKNPWLIPDEEDWSETRQIQKIIDQKRRDQPYIKRKIDFPFYHNKSKDEAEAYLKEHENENVVVRPSSKGLNYLSLSWKMTTNPPTVVHFSIKETNKAAGAFSVGQTLEVLDEQYDDLDEIVARFVERMTELTKLVTDDGKFRYGTQAEIDQLLREENSENNNMQIPYTISFSETHPGRFVLSYLPGRKKIIHEYIALSPKGLRFRKYTFATPEDLKNWFKKNWQNHPAKRKPKKEPDRRSHHHPSRHYPSQRSENTSHRRGGGTAGGRRSSWDHKREPTRSYGYQAMGRA